MNNGIMPEVFEEGRCLEIQYQIQIFTICLQTFRNWLRIRELWTNIEIKILVVIDNCAWASLSCLQTTNAIKLHFEFHDVKHRRLSLMMSYKCQKASSIEWCSNQWPLFHSTLSLCTKIPFLNELIVHIFHCIIVERARITELMRIFFSQSVLTSCYT